MTGIYPAVMTAYDDDGNISIARTLELVDRLLAAGVHGLFVGGTAGEGPLQGTHERRSLASAISDHVGGAVPVIVHVGALPYRDTLELAKHARDEGIRRVAAIPPLYYSLEATEIDDYFRALAADLGAPVMAYHVPHLSHRAMSAERLVGLAREGVIDGVKYSTDDLAELQNIIECTDDDFLVLSGSDPLCMAAALVGSSGAVGVSMNAMPALFVRLWDSVREGRLDEAAALQATASRFVANMFGHNFIAYLRHILDRQGIDLGANRPPLPNLDASAKGRIDAFIAAHPDIQQALGLN